MSSSHSTTVLRTKVRPGRAQFMCGLLALAAFGPYVGDGIRTEQAAVYLVAIAALLALPYLKPCGWSYLLPWAGILVVAAMSLLTPIMEHAPWGAGSLLGGVDNFFLPVAVMLIVWTLVKRSNAVPALEAVARVTVWGSVASSVVGILSTQVDLTNFLALFWGGGEGADTTTAENAATMGRYSGIFNQPAEAGLVYSLALILAVWLYSRKPVLLYPALGILAIGGILTVSKIFLFIGLPLAIWYLFCRYRLGGKLLTLASLVGMFALIAESGFVQEWDGFSYFARLFEAPQGNAVGFYTAGRWDENSNMLGVIDAVLTARPLNGFGFAGRSVAYDSAWTEVIVVGGLPGAACLAMAFVAIFRQAYRTGNPARRRLTYLVALLMAGASLGLPVLTANRAATLVWLVLALLALARTPRNRATTEHTQTLSQRTLSDR